MKTEFVLPGEIEKRSFEIIAAELKERNIKLDNKLAPVICRAIHTTADFDYAHTLVFSEGALDKLKELIKSGAAIVTDTNMALSGINKKTLAAFGCEAKCLMADETVAKLAKEQKIDFILAVGGGSQVCHSGPGVHHVPAAYAGDFRSL